VNTSLRLAAAATLAAILSLSPITSKTAEAQTTVSAQSGAVIVGNDRGGFIRQRLRDLRSIRASGRAVEIRGNICYSTCTMYLGLPNTCVSRGTTFGFHGPSIMGVPMQSQDFETVSRIISSYYPEPLRNWYMTEARYRLNGVHRVSASEIIAMGIREC
jgi:hypothetical protein